MAAKRDYYEVLGVSRNASADGIKKAFRGLAKRYHPDLNPDDKKSEDKFKEVQEAYEVLSDPEKRKTYDMFGASGFRQGPGAGRGRPGRGSAYGFDFGGAGGFEGLDSIFEDLFARASPGARRQATRAQRPRKGRDSEHNLTIDFDTSLHGGTRDITISKDGGARGIEHIEVKIPRGVRDGTKIRVSGKGQPGTGNARPGDLYLKIKVSPHPIFKRKRDDIYLELPITLYEAVLGGKVSVPTKDGTTAELTIPQGVKSGTKLRLKGKGAPNPKTGVPGDQYVVVSIVMPETIDPGLRESIEELSRENPYDPRKHLQRYMR